MRLEDLLQSVDKMSLDELQSLVREIRKDRMVSKKIQVKTAKVTREKTKGSARDLIAALSPEDRAKLIAKLTGA
jgi:hypothetical protein